MPTLLTVLRWVPLAVYIFMMAAAALLFTATPTKGKRDLRGMGIGAAFWTMWAATRVAAPPPFWMSALGVAGCALSLVVFVWAGVSIRGRVFSFAGEDDLPQFVHAEGPYAYVRNPFYLSYLVALFSAAIMWPSVWTAAVAVAAIGYFQWLTRFEEAKFSRSPVAAEYGLYKARTGRLLPRR